MFQKSGAHQLWLVVYPVICRVLYIQTVVVSDLSINAKFSRHILRFKMCKSLPSVGNQLVIIYNDFWNSPHGPHITKLWKLLNAYHHPSFFRDLRYQSSIVDPSFFGYLGIPTVVIAVAQLPTPTHQSKYEWTTLHRWHCLQLKIWGWIRIELMWKGGSCSCFVPAGFSFWSQTCGTEMF